MPTQTAKAYRSSLPTFKNNDFWEVTLKVGAVITIVLPMLTLIFKQQTFHEYIYSVYIVVLAILMLSYILLQEKKKLHRYAQSTFFVHYVNHVVRDVLTLQRRDMSISIDTPILSSYFLDPIRTSFSIVTGKHCRVCIKELKPDQTIITIARDTMSDKIGNTDRNGDIVHLLTENTDFENLWYWRNGSSRYFLCADLPSLYRDNAYKNSSFKEVGQPVVENMFLGGKVVKNWKLPYKSTLVIPIRYISDKAITASTGAERENAQHYWGFLCIDCHSRGIFDSTFCPELGASFADALYTLFSQLAHMKESFRELEEATRPCKS